MRFGEPTFLVPSKDFHELAAPSVRAGVWRFTMAATMEPRTRDRWHAYKVGTLELGQRLLEIMRELKKSYGRAFPPADLFATADVLWVRPGRRRLS